MAAHITQQTLAAVAAALVAAGTAAGARVYVDHPDETSEGPTATPAEPDVSTDDQPGGSE